MPMPMSKHIAYIGLGGNLGDPLKTVQAAIHELGGVRTSCLAHCSSLYLSAPVEASGNDYINAVVALHTQLTPTELHADLQNIEQRFGRARSYLNAPRTLDLDLLLYDQLEIKLATLQIPHPRMTQRAFVILPLLEIAPDVFIPGFGPAHTFLPQLQNQVIQKLA
jgi:2-amino-4-hydroxy-6-hydroxymethyldihydropteridine diphosphokinase